MGEEEKEEEEEAAPRTIDIKFNYPQTSAFPSHYFVQQSQLLPFKRFQSIQRRKGEERRRGGRELESPAVSFTRPLSTPPSIHNVFTTFRPRTQNPRIVSRARVSGRGFYRSPFLKHTRAGERERTSNSLLCSRFQSVSMHRLCHRPISFFPLLLLLLPRFYRRQTIFRTGEVSTVFLFFFSLSLSLGK